MIIRPPSLQDVDALIELAPHLHKESAYSFLPFEVPKVRALIMEYLSDRIYRCGLVAEAGGVTIGMIGGVLVEYYFCSEKLVADEVLFVRSDHRGGQAAARLIRGLRQWSVARGARELCLSVSTSINLARTTRFYERLGFTGVGGVFKMRLESSSAEPNLNDR